ncbi:MAG TPA: hypothetical protein VF772_20720, partial [Terriglobales bacterium]
MFLLFLAEEMPEAHLGALLLVAQALEAYPNNLDIIMSQASVAQAMKDNGKVVDYAVEGANV